MEFKIDETDDFDEEEEFEDNDEDENDHNDDEDEFDTYEDDKDEDENTETPTYQDTEPDEPNDDYDDENEFDDDTPVIVERIVVPEFTDEEANNFDYADAIRAYYEDKNYEYAIEQFSKVIKSEKKGKKKDIMDNNEILAKSLYWQAEAYVKTQDFTKAIKAFESLVKTCKEHYLIIAAQRRADNLKAKLS